MRVAFLLVLPLISSLALAEEKAPKREPDRSAEETGRIVRSLEPKFRQILEDLKVPGAAIVVVKDDKVVYLNGLGYRDLKKKQPFTPDTLCHIASTSKAFCGVTLCIAAAEGKLSLDESPKRLLPDFHMRGPEADRGMTIADLMEHSSGLPRTDMAWWSGVIDAREASRLLSEGEPTYPFRYVGQYSNMMVETAGLAVGAAYGKPWTEVLQEKVTGPLGMTSTRRWSLPSDDPGRAAVGYYVGLDGKPTAETMTLTPALAAAGGLQSTARDMGTWVRFHLNGGEVDGKRLLPAAVLNEAHRPRFAYNGAITYGLGWFQNRQRGEEVVYHGGDLPGFQSNVVLVPSRHLGFAVLTNNDSTNSRPAFENAILDRLIGERDLRENKKTAKIAGLYLTAKGDHLMRVETSGTELWATIDGARMVRLRKVEDGTWKSYDAHDVPMTATVREDAKRKGKKEIDLAFGGTTQRFATVASDYRAETTPKALYRRMAQTLGLEAARAGKILECQYTARYASDGVDSVGLLYRAPTGRSGQFEHELDGDRALLYSHGAVREGRTASVDSTYRLDESAGLLTSVQSSMAGYCNEMNGVPKGAQVAIIGEVAWKGEPSFVVRTTWPAGVYRLDCVSKSRALPLRREIPGVAIETYEDYEMVDGIAVPMRVTMQDSNLSQTHIKIVSAHAIDRDAHWAFYPYAWDHEKTK